MKTKFSVLIIFFSISIFSLEIGKITDNPFDSVNEINVFNNILISKEFVCSGYIIDSFSFYSNLPIFSVLEYNNKVLIGTGTVPMIIDITNNDTIATFLDGEIVYDLIQNSKNSFIASIQPTGIIVKIENNKIDTIYKFENKAVNILKKINKNIYLAIENKLYIYADNSFNEIYRVDDKNITYITEINNKIYIGTEGNGQVIEINGKKKKLLYSFKSSEIDFIGKKEKSIYLLVNTLSGKKDQQLYNSNFIKITEEIEDTIYNGKEMLLTGEKNKNGIYLFKASRSEILFYDYDNLYSCGILNSDFIMSYNKIGKNIYISTGDPGRVYKITETKEKSTFFSHIIDFEKKVTVNSIYWNTDNRGKLYVRFGNSPVIDSNWTEFMYVKPKENEKFSEYRYLQYKYMFNDTEDKLYNVDFYYKTINHSPVIKNVQLYPPRIIPDYIQDNSLYTYDIDNKKMYPEYKDENIVKTDRKVLFVSWNGSDIDGDFINYNIYLSDKSGLYPVKKDITNNYVLIYADVFDEGYYNIEIIADDSLSNGDKYKTCKYIKKRIYIDNTSPEIMNVKFEKNHLYFNAIDKFSFINEVFYSVNGSEFNAVKPIDYIFDSKNENFDIKINRDKNEDLLIMIYVLDEYGNIAKYKKIVK